jgi:hypothetical protein
MFENPEQAFGGWPRSGFSDLGNIELGVSEYKKPQVEVHRLPHLRIEMWATQL